MQLIVDRRQVPMRLAFFFVHARMPYAGKRIRLECELKRIAFDATRRTIAPSSTERMLCKF
ncbi:hypothetical protein PSAB6_570107 [Paraburkholderia sabiae]|nr:hypothetical protein PSAB6_570107 [Paraburkholderia sabiae]